MADRFPSIDDIDAGQTGGNDGSFDLVNDSTDQSDFLARERAALGDDADQFGTPQDNAPRVDLDVDDDLLGGGGGHTNDVTQFESSFPSIDSRNERVAPGGSTITGAPTASTYNPSPYTAEPSVITEWRERRALAIQHREDVASDKKAATIKSAQESIDEFYENYNNKKDRNIKQSQKEAEEFLAKREDTTAGGTSWERIAKLVDVRGKAGPAVVGKERFRELLGSLLKDENAPGAKGY